MQSRMERRKSPYVRLTEMSLILFWFRSQPAFQFPEALFSVPLLLGTHEWREEGSELSNRPH